MPKQNEVLISFPSVEAAKEFMDWMSNAGEQDYWTASEYSSGEKHYVGSFEYDHQRNIMVGTGNIKIEEGGTDN